VDHASTWIQLLESEPDLGKAVKRDVETIRASRNGGLELRPPVRSRGFRRL
jgi:hypothetical protein